MRQMMIPGEKRRSQFILRRLKYGAQICRTLKNNDCVVLAVPKYFFYILLISSAKMDA